MDCAWTVLQKRSVPSSFLVESMSAGTTVVRKVVQGTETAGWWHNTGRHFLQQSFCVLIGSCGDGLLAGGPNGGHLRFVAEMDFAFGGEKPFARMDCAWKAHGLRMAVWD